MSHNFNWICVRFYHSIHQSGASKLDHHDKNQAQRTRVMAIWRKGFKNVKYQPQKSSKDLNEGNVLRRAREGKRTYCTV